MLEMFSFEVGVYNTSASEPNVTNSKDWGQLDPCSTMIQDKMGATPEVFQVVSARKHPPYPLRVRNR